VALGAAGALIIALAAYLTVHGLSGSNNKATPPASSGPTTTTTTVPATTTTPPPYMPPPVTPVIAPPLTGEGQWSNPEPWSPQPPSILTTTFRTDPTQPSIVAYAAFMRSTNTQLALYPGNVGPGPTTLDRGPEEVPLTARQSLLAAFNSGFYEKDSAAGFYAHGTLYYPMVNGLATVVTYTDAATALIDWEGGPTPGPDVVMARQNLPLLVDNGAPTPTAPVNPDWGVTLHGALAVWRTGLGIDTHGNLMYVAAPAQTALSLAKILVQLGAVRAMQLDINPEWPIFVTYGAPGAASPSLFVPNPNQIPTRFLYSSTKDFFALYIPTPGQVQQPW
jgi:hypothetical protein